MVLLTTTPRIIAALEAIPAAQCSEIDLPTSAQAGDSITHDQLLRLAKYLQNDTPYQATHLSAQPHTTVLNDLLRGTRVYVAPPPKKPEPTPEYLASKARLLAEAERLAYTRLLNPSHTLDPSSTDPYASSTDASEDPLTLSLIFNIFLSVIITGFSVYWALTKFHMPVILATLFTQWTSPNLDLGRGQPSASASASAGASDAVKILISFFAAIAVAVAEAFLYGAYLEKVSRARAKEKRMKERKVVIGPVEGDGDVGEMEGTEMETVAQAKVDRKEEIWGKGVNGGVRRRVREKWEKERNQESVTD
ncbi:hypothetical protein N7539_001788 [Penicillium diatomitis]|uniref:ATPase, vacuolar ER assembly factor, Vma12 n=1 Tax=Penicillium diatomitis TaxID=2819901 RepID=A0A9X0C004_9EURO|nr:uncharacterized protein N7539_001788 [Penicillium diatomitis]KAJ5493042.1 hypothetical protein N7539_001788 [Penicillium diatomitis]